MQEEIVELDVLEKKRSGVYRTYRDDTSLSRWSPASWLNLLLEKHGWLSAGLVWMNGSSVSGLKGLFEEPRPDGLESRPTMRAGQVRSDTLPPATVIKHELVGWVVDHVHTLYMTVLLRGACVVFDKAVQLEDRHSDLC